MKTTTWRDYTDDPHNKWVIRGWPIIRDRIGKYKDSDCPIIDFVEGDYISVLIYARQFRSFYKINSMGVKEDAGKIEKFVDVIGKPIFDQYRGKEITFKKV